jgi:hypothetical protein
MERWIQLCLTLNNDGLRQRDGSPIAPMALPISDDLRERLAAWCARLWNTLADESITDIARTPAGRESAWTLIDAFDKAGFAIARALKAELPDWTVYYHDAATVTAEHFGRPAAECGASTATEFGVLIENP